MSRRKLLAEITAVPPDDRTATWQRYARRPSIPTNYFCNE
jgi:hypothetical protein